MGKIADITGQRFGRLVVMEPHPIRAKNRDIRWVCKCDCGNTTIATKYDLVSGKIQSCGCLQKELLSKRSFKHGRSNSKLLSIKSAMEQRCYNPNNNVYKYYGGRGITICDEWRDSSLSFLEWADNNGYEEGLSIERIDNNGPYSPENCKWIPRREQPSNTRSSRYITYKNQTKTLAQWSKEVGIKAFTLSQRLIKGWTDEETLTIPPGTTQNIKEWRKKHGKSNG